MARAWWTRISVSAGGGAASVGTGPAGGGGADGGGWGQPTPRGPPAPRRARGGGAPARTRGLAVGDLIDAGDGCALRGPIASDPLGRVRGRRWPRPPSVVGVVHVELGVNREWVGFVSDRRIDHLEHELALTRVGGQGNEAVP